VKNIQVPPGGNPVSEAKIFDDYPVSETEFFNFDAYANAIAGIIQSKNTGTPLVIGIVGDWGSGKTSLMRTIEKKIGKKENGYPQTIWFNAWKFDKEDSIRRALLMRVLEELKTRGEDDEKKSEKEKKLDQELTDLQTSLYHEVNREELGDFNFDLGKAAKGTLKLSLSLVPVIGSNLTKLIEKGANEEEAIKDILESVQREKKAINIKKIQFMEEFHNKFEKIIEDYYVDKRVVIFIDDLDRSLPEKALEVLDAIKLFLDAKGCIFVLGIDRRVISYIINRKYRELVGEGEEKENGTILITGENYLEKIIQLSFQLPPIKDEDMKKFISNLGGLDSEFYGQYLELITEGIENNPRKIKRFFNIIELQRNIAEAMNLQKDLSEAEQIIYDSLMIIWTIISLNHPEFRDAVLRNQLILKPVLFRELPKYFKFKELPEQTEQVDYFLNDKPLSNLVTQFHEYIYKQEDKLKSEEIPEMRLNNLIQQVISLGHVTGEKVEEKELINLQNNADLLIREAEVALKELEDAPPDQKKEIETSIEEIKKAFKEKDTNRIKATINELTNGINAIQQSVKQQEISTFETERKEDTGLIDELSKAIKKRESLAGKNLSKVNLKGVNLSFMNLDEANLSEANLENAKLTQAKLNRAILDRAVLIGARLNNAKLWYASLKEAKLNGANLKDAELYRANLFKADLSGADLYNVGLMSANLKGAVLRGASLRQVYLKGATFDNETDFRGADIDSVTIDDLEGSDWDKAQWDPLVFEEIRKKHKA